MDGTNFSICLLILIILAILACYCIGRIVELCINLFVYVKNKKNYNSFYRENIYFVYNKNDNKLENSEGSTRYPFPNVRLNDFIILVVVMIVILVFLFVFS